MKLTKKQDFLVMVFWPLFIAGLSLILNLNSLYFLLLFFAVPAAYLSFKMPGQVKKSLTFSFVFGSVWTILDCFWEMSNAWVTPSVFPFKFLGVASMENIIWIYIWVYFVVMFYEYFFEHDSQKEKTTKLTHSLIFVVSLGLLVLAIMVSFFKIHVYVPYSYFILGSLCLIPLVFLLTKYSKIRSKFLGVGTYFFYNSMVFELLALYLNYWYFPDIGQFLGTITIFGLVFPLEEYVIFISLGSIGFLALYELFDDDRK